MLQRFRYLFIIAYFLLLLIHFVIKDRFPYISVLFYASPLPLIILFGILVAIFWRKQKNLFYGILLSLIALNIYFSIHYFGSKQEAAPESTITNVLFWNVAKQKPLPVKILVEHINASNPFIVALVEAREVSDDDIKVLKSSLPDYTVQILDGEMLVLVKGAISSYVYESLSDVYKFNHLNIEIDNEQTSVMLADVYASPLLNKEIPLDYISKAMDKYKVDVLVGDFNTPYESVFFNNIKEKYVSFHDCSLGMTATWPVPVPLIEIDQVWICNKFKLLKMEKHTYDVSDHKLLIASYERTK
ncbi:endonuclease/exonuclease/phosphatase family protein [Subsaxibacter sp. CAU 1640]|uniref:endonuclease/exonuclease/phosphatase family protein n=1 Tax=Subsaxibacter sp. CAU 1640 TaxID=2933271 RepID=UPI002005C271|nr:endonuclease/exonuclease/phosphatase family protein [Subsaxibacter sp. CAU 1640]MCK7588971.1 endonuclease/exonuclease/phosphatase family protein [Subsaxibacter sp. CAU 1640]